MKRAPKMKKQAPVEIEEPSQALRVLLTSDTVGQVITWLVRDKLICSGHDHMSKESGMAAAAFLACLSRSILKATGHDPFSGLIRAADIAYAIGLSEKTADADRVEECAKDVEACVWRHTGCSRKDIAKFIKGHPLATLQSGIDFAVSNGMIREDITGRTKTYFPRRKAKK